MSSGGTKSPHGTSPSLWQVRKGQLIRGNHLLNISYYHYPLCGASFIHFHSCESFVTSPDSMGSGDDDEDNDLEDSSAEIENDQVYISKGP